MVAGQARGTEQLTCGMGLRVVQASNTRRLLDAGTIGTGHTAASHHNEFCGADIRRKRCSWKCAWSPMIARVWRPPHRHRPRDLAISRPRNSGRCGTWAYWKRGLVGNGRLADRARHAAPGVTGEQSSRMRIVEKFQRLCSANGGDRSQF